MFNQAIVRVGIRYGVLSGLISIVLVALLYLLGYNPLGDAGRISFAPIPVFVFLAIRNYKRYHLQELSFGKGFRVGLATSFYNALAAGMLLFLLLYAVGPEMMQRHIADLQQVLQEMRAEQVEVLGEEKFDEAAQALQDLQPSMVAADDFIRRMVAGLVFSLVAAVFFRK